MNADLTTKTMKTCMTTNTLHLYLQDHRDHREEY